MSVFFNKDNDELVVTCGCGWEDHAAHIKILHDKEDDDFCYLTYLNGNFYKEQNQKISEVFKRKLRKIWAIVVNKDYYYSDIIMSRKEFEQFKEFINQY